MARSWRVLKCLRGRIGERLIVRVMLRRRYPLRPQVRGPRLRSQRRLRLRMFHLQ